MRRVVVKLGGELLDEAHQAEAAALAADLAQLDGRLLMVHGGGPQTTALQKRLGQTPKIVGGRRVTDAAALEAIKMVVAGKLNVDLVSLLTRAGVPAVGLNGVSAQVIEAVKRPPRVVSGSDGVPVDFGHVGDVTGVNAALLEQLWAGQYVPVLACLGSDAEGRPFNINADVVACHLASKLAAEALVLVTGAPGVLRDRYDPSTRIPTLNAADAERAIADGVIAAGMIPKIEEAFGALRRGVKTVHVVGGLGPGDLLGALRGSGAVGTTLVA